jgi:hypothetical protein
MSGTGRAVEENLMILTTTVEESVESLLRCARVALYQTELLILLHDVR